ncbi:MAG: ABC transporter substrate-binding protein [Alphaproteobacteria bacterium]|nr:ABC transporter substrate-binding protein [Alphaproteobacteria bacterium]
MSPLLLLLACTANPDGLTPGAGNTAPVYGGTFVYADEDDIRTLDPAIGYDEVSWTAMHLVFDQLIAYAPDTDGTEVRMVGGLAESWDVSEDGLVWTFRLRPGVTFHNGRELVADDVVYSWTRLFDPELASPGADFFGGISGSQAMLDGETDHLAGLVALDTRTVQVTLDAPDATFANAVAMVFGSVVPREEVEARGEQWAFSPVGTGPFELSEWQLGEKTVFVADEDHWEPGRPYLDEIVHLAGYPRTVQFLKLEAGELSQINRMSSPDYLWARQDERWGPLLQEVPSIDTYGEMMNTELPPFDDLAFRQGVAASIDREKLKKLRNGRYRPTISWVPPGLAAHVEWDELSADEQHAYRYQRHDPALAKQRLSESRYMQDGRYVGPPIVYWALSDEASLTTAQSVQQDLSLAGVPMTVKTTTFPAYLAAVGQPKTVQIAYTAWVMDYPDPRNFLEVIFSCDMRAEQNSQNTSFYCDDETERLLDAAAVEVDPDVRADLYERAQARIAEAAPVAIEYHSTSLSLVQPRVKGFRVHPIWTRDMREAWLDVPEGRPTRAGGAR